MWIFNSTMLILILEARFEVRVGMLSTPCMSYRVNTKVNFYFHPVDPWVKNNSRDVDRRLYINAVDIALPRSRQCTVKTHFIYDDSPLGDGYVRTDEIEPRDRWLDDGSCQMPEPQIPRLHSKATGNRDSGTASWMNRTRFIRSKRWNGTINSKCMNSLRSD